MISSRYGSLERIAHRTDCRCHLCHRRVDLATYGDARRHGGATATVDHLWPQSWGIDDDPENLRIAHQSCNSRRGTRDVKETRVALAGTAAEPWSGTAWNVATIGTGVGVGFAAGKLFATRNERGEEEFNWGAATLGFLLTTTAMTVVRSAA